MSDEMNAQYGDPQPSRPADPAGVVPGPRARPVGRTRLAIGAAVVAVGLVGGGGYALANGSTSTASTAAATTTAGSTAGSGAAGSSMAGRGMFTPPAQGTVTAVSASGITVQTATGTSTYKINSATTVQDNGATATVAALKMGDTVVVFTGAGPGTTVTSADSTLANRILAGTSATQGPGAGGPGPAGAGTQAPSSTSSGAAASSST